MAMLALDTVCAWLVSTDLRNRPRFDIETRLNTFILAQDTTRLVLAGRSPYTFVCRFHLQKIHLSFVTASVHELLHEHRLARAMGIVTHGTEYDLGPQPFIGETQAEVEVTQADMQQYYRRYLEDEPEPEPTSPYHGR